MYWHISWLFVLQLLQKLKCLGTTVREETWETFMLMGIYLFQTSSLKMT